MRARYPRDLGLKKDLPAFLLGLLATSFQILLLREFAAYFAGNELTLGLILASWLLWVGLGSLAAGRRKRPLPSRLSLGFLTVLLFPCALLAVRLSRFLFHLSSGEIVGPGPVLILSLGVCFLVGFPLGVLFVSNVVRQAGNVRRVYILESAGACAAGLLVHFLLAVVSSSWAIAAAIAAAAVFLGFLAEPDRPLWIWPLGVVVLLGGFWLADGPSQRAYWRPFELLASRDTRYGRQQVIQIKDQRSLYSNNSPAYSLPDPGAAEEAVHFAMLQRPNARRVMLIGGGLGGTLGELLKYRAAEIDYVELDPAVVGLSRRFVGEEVNRDLEDPRVRLFFRDGRDFLRRSKSVYQVILLNLPEPATAQVNRYYTREFFLLARSHLASDGLLSFSVPSSETAIGPELRMLLTSLRATLIGVFPMVRVVPGNRNIFLASGGPLTLDPGELGGRLTFLGLTTRFLDSRSLRSRLHELRLRYLEEQLSSGVPRINSDLSPAAFFLSVAHWSAQFQGGESAFLRFLTRVPVPLLLGLPLLLLALFLAVLRGLKKEAAFCLLPLGLMGLTTIVAEIVVLLWFQAARGFLYGRIALLLSVFMLGLSLGGLIPPPPERLAPRRLTAVQLGFLAVLAGLRLGLPSELPETFALAVLFSLGILGGSLFVVSNALYLRLKVDYGRGYGFELVGSFIGALITSTLLIPLAGLGRVIDWILLLNLLGLAFFLSRPGRSRSAI